MILLLMVLMLPTLPTQTDVEGWRIAKGTYFTLHSMDMGLTYAGIHQGYTEGNPIAKWYVERPGLDFAVGTGLMIATGHLLDLARKENKTLGWVLWGVLTVAKAYIVWHNMKILELR